MKKICKVSGETFEITKSDLEFYKKMGVPIPTLCPRERMIRRLSWRNERNLHHRICSATDKKIVSMYSSEVEFPVYNNDYWWSDNWEAKDYGQSVDFSRGFFEQFKELLDKTPKMARIQQGTSENSQFTNCASYNKNCYLTFSANLNEDCLYGNFILSSKNSIDNLYLNNSELCYESVNTKDSYDSSFLQDCINCTSSMFLKNCISCTNCFGSMNLKNKKYYFLNKKYSKEEYFKKLETLELGKYSKLKDMRKNSLLFFKTLPQKYAEVLQNENSSGNYIFNSKNAKECWDATNLEDCKFCSDGERIKSSYDVNYYGCTETNELLYECEGVGHGVYNVKFSKLCWGGCKNLDYCYECFKTSDCFGCIGLKNAQYCIFNKQYSKEEYLKIRGKIIEMMMKNREWGEFFPSEMSVFGYNKTLAGELYFKPKEVILSEGLRWDNEEPTGKYSGEKYEIPDNISEVSDEILKQILVCESSGKNYRVIKPELEFYRKMNLPIPRICPDERHKQRIKLRNPRELHSRNCDNCKDLIQTTFAPDRPEKVFCEKCYVDVIT